MQRLADMLPEEEKLSIVDFKCQLYGLGSLYTHLTTLRTLGQGLQRVQQPWKQQQKCSS